MPSHHHPGEHAHHHTHAHGPMQPGEYGRSFAIGIILNLGFVLVEGTYGFLANSMALLSDAGHNLSDVLGLVLAWGAAILGKRRPTQRFTYGLRSSSILAALFNALLLLVAVGGIVWESIGRLAEPEPVAAVTVMIVAGVGILVNGFTAWLFMSGSRDDINIRGAFLHMAADAAVSLGTVLAGLLILWTDRTWIDPVLSLVIAAVIVWGTWDLLRQSLTLSLQGVPNNIALSEVKAALEALPGVVQVHHLHIWAVSTTETALTGHLVMPDGHPGNGFLADAQHRLQHRFGIGHATLQIEVDPAASHRDDRCSLDSSPHPHDHASDRHDSDDRGRSR